MDELSNRGLLVLHGPPRSSFYTREIMGFPPRLKYLNTDINIFGPLEAVRLDSGGASPILSFSSSPSDSNGDDNDDTMFPPPRFGLNEDGSREVLLETHPLVRNNMPGGHRSRIPSPAFCITVPDDDPKDVDTSMGLGPAEPSTPSQSIDEGLLFRDMDDDGPNNSNHPMDSVGRSIKFVYKRKH